MAAGAFVIVLVLVRGGVMLSLLASIGEFDFGGLVGITFAIVPAGLRLVCFDFLIRDDSADANLVRKEGVELLKM